MGSLESAPRAKLRQPHLQVPVMWNSSMWYGTLREAANHTKKFRSARTLEPNIDALSSTEKLSLPRVLRHEFPHQSLRISEKRHPNLEPTHASVLFCTSPRVGHLASSLLPLGHALPRRSQGCYGELVQRQFVTLGLCLSGLKKCVKPKCPPRRC